MKNIKVLLSLSLIIIIGLPTFTHAQLVKGDKIISGTFNLNTNSSSITQGSSVTNGPKTTNVNIVVGGMSIVSEQTGPGALGLGVQLSLLNTINTQAANGGTTTLSNPTFGIAPFARSYFTNTSDLAIFAEGIIGMSFGSVIQEVESNSGTTSTKVNTTGFNISVGPGFNYFLTDNIGLEFMFGSLGYSTTSTKQSSNSKNVQSNFGISLDLSTVQVGISYKL